MTPEDMERNLLRALGLTAPTDPCNVVPSPNNQEDIMETIALDLEDRRRMAFEALKIRAETIMAVMPDEPEKWFFTDSDVLDIADAWTVSDMDAECVMDDQDECITHADHHLLAFMIEGYVQALTGRGESE